MTHKAWNKYFRAPAKASKGDSCKTDTSQLHARNGCSHDDQSLMRNLYTYRTLVLPSSGRNIVKKIYTPLIEFVLLFSLPFSIPLSFSVSAAAAEAAIAGEGKQAARLHVER